jgi:hypothetical protein
MQGNDGAKNCGRHLPSCVPKLRFYPPRADLTRFFFCERATKAVNCQSVGLSMPREVLTDNYTLQGAYGYLKNANSRELLFESCLAHLVELLVVYDRIYVPADVLERNAASSEVASFFPEVISGKALPETPDIHHSAVNMEVLERLRPLINTDPFRDVDLNAAVQIEQIGHPFPTPPERMGKYQYLTFGELHTYYTWFCVELSWAYRVNYAPNPIRNRLLITSKDIRLPVLPNLQKDVIRLFEETRKSHVEETGRMFPSLSRSLQFPMVYEYVRSNASSIEDIVEATRRLRDSKEAIGFRAFCVQLEEYYSQGRADLADENRKQIEELSQQWAQTLAEKKIRKSIRAGFSLLFIKADTDLQVPDRELHSVVKRPQFVFLHNLLSASYRRKSFD